MLMMIRSRLHHDQDSPAVVVTPQLLVEIGPAMQLTAVGYERLKKVQQPPTVVVVGAVESASEYERRRQQAAAAILHLSRCLRQECRWV